MSEWPFFRPRLANQSELPWFDRHLLEGLTQFGPDPADGFTVYLTAEAVITLHIGTYEQAPHEAIGLLMGRAYADDIGSFTVVSGVVYAEELETSDNHVQLSQEEMLELRIQASRMHPATDFVGWTHSHKSFSKYSSVDLKEQKNWTEHYHIGILTFMDKVIEARNTHWAILYRGPSAQIIPFVVDETPLLRKLGELPSSRNGEEVIPAKKSGELSSRTQGQEREVLPLPGYRQLEQVSSGQHRSWYRRSLFSLLRGASILLIVIIGVILGNFLTSRLEISQPTLSTSNLFWNCDQQMGHVPLRVTCIAPVGSGIKGWVWNFGDGTQIQRSSAAHVYTKPGVYTITLTIIASISPNADTAINAGSIHVEVIASTATRSREAADSYTIVSSRQ